jgi:hypothetical protein
MPFTSSFAHGVSTPDLCRWHEVLRRREARGRPPRTRRAETVERGGIEVAHTGVRRRTLRFDRSLPLSVQVVAERRGPETYRREIQRLAAASHSAGSRGCRGSRSGSGMQCSCIPLSRAPRCDNRHYLTCHRVSATGVGPTPAGRLRDHRRDSAGAVRQVDYARIPGRTSHQSRIREAERHVSRGGRGNRHLMIIYLTC